MHYRQLRLEVTGNHPGLYGIRRGNLVDELTLSNYRDNGIWRIGPGGPVYVYICRGEPRNSKGDTIHFCVRAYRAPGFNADFDTLTAALDYANCRSESDLSRTSRPATIDEYPPDIPGNIGTYILGITRPPKLRRTASPPTRLHDVQTGDRGTAAE